MDLKIRPFNALVKAMYEKLRVSLVTVAHTCLCLGPVLQKRLCVYVILLV
jgi:hypothetical protein